jgi:7-cyano-7-deazaguanine synthase
MIDSVVVVSGGMDSVTLLHYLIKTERRTPAVISFLYGQKHHREIECARSQAALLDCPVHKVVDLSVLRPLFDLSSLTNPALTVPMYDPSNHQPSTYVPNRNMIFLALAVAFAETLGVGQVYYGAQAHDLYGYWDTTPQFVDALNQVYRLNPTTSVQVNAPFVNYSKSDVLRTGLELGVDFGLTWSCYAGQEQACGECPTCSERLKAFEALNMRDPLPYLRRD